MDPHKPTVAELAVMAATGRKPRRFRVWPPSPWAIFAWGMNAGLGLALAILIVLFNSYAGR